MTEQIIKNNEDVYLKWLEELKTQISQNRHRAALSVNFIAMQTYWTIGKDIVKKEKQYEWGSSFIGRLSRDLSNHFKDIKGFSRRNLYAIRQWYLFYSEISEFVPQPVAQIPWGHNRLIISKVKNINEALWYADATTKNGWARDLLELKIKKNEYQRIGQSITNFNTALQSPQSELAHETLKDPYNFDFLGLEDEAQEREIERGLVGKISDFILELGKGFAFIGNQYKLIVNEQEYYIDLLFYHMTLRCYVVIELKSVKFKPEFSGKMNFYLSAIDSQLKNSTDNPSIGLILCRSKNSLEVEYALRDINKPIGVSEYILTEKLPKDYTKSLPTVEEIEMELKNRLSID